MSTFLPALTGALDATIKRQDEERLRKQQLEDEARKTKINLLSREFERGYGERSPALNETFLNQIIGEIGLPKDQANTIIGMNRFLTAQQKAQVAREGGIPVESAPLPGLEGTVQPTISKQVGEGRATTTPIEQPKSPAQIRLAELQSQLQRVDLPPNQRVDLRKEMTDIQTKMLSTQETQFQKAQERAQRLREGQALGFPPDLMERGEFFQTYGIDPYRYSAMGGAGSQFLAPKFIEFPDGQVRRVFTHKSTGQDFVQDEANGQMTPIVVPPNSREYRQYGDYFYPTEGGGVGRISRGSAIGTPPGTVANAPTPRQWMQLPGVGAQDVPSLVDSMADRIASNELSPAEALAQLGGQRTGLGGLLALSLDRKGVRVLPEKLREQITSTYGAQAKLQEFENQVRRIIQAPDLINQAEETLILEGAAGAMAAFISRALGERGVLTDRDVIRAQGLIPGWKAANFAPDYALKEINYFKNLLTSHRGVLENDSFRPIARGGNAPAGGGGGGRKVGEEFQATYDGKKYIFKVQPNGKAKAIREVK